MRSPRLNPSSLVHMLKGEQPPLNEVCLAIELLERRMERIEAGRAHCVLCGEVIRLEEEALVTPDFLADEGEEFWRFADAPMHRACFLVWDRRKAFVARYNRMARHWVWPDGSHPRMTSEGEIVQQWSGLPPPDGPPA